MNGHATIPPLGERLATIWKARLSSPGDRLVLLAVMEFMNDETGECFPAVDILAELTQMGKNTVKRSISRLSAAGMIHRQARSAKGMKTSNGYAIDWGALRGVARVNPRFPYRRADGNCAESAQLENDDSPMAHSGPTMAHDGPTESPDGPKWANGKTRENDDSPMAHSGPTMAQIGTSPMAHSGPRTRAKTRTQCKTEEIVHQEEDCFELNASSSPSLNPPKPTISPADFQAAWNSSVPLARIRSMTPSRVEALRIRCAAPDWVKDLPSALSKINTSPFLRGENERGWKATADWFLKPDTLNKILEDQFQGEPTNAYRTSRDLDRDSPAILRAPPGKYDRFNPPARGASA